jgi:hypothetical protein
MKRIVIPLATLPMVKRIYAVFLLCAPLVLALPVSAQPFTTLRWRDFAVRYAVQAHSQRCAYHAAHVLLRVRVS